MFKNNRGDTIVEVLVSIAVLSLILGASYALANQASQANRQAQERAEALGQAERQVELLKDYVSNNNALPAGIFCMLGADSVHNFSTPPDRANLQNYGPCSAGPDGRYNLDIENVSTAEFEQVNTTVRWFQIDGGEIDELQIYYRL